MGISWLAFSEALVKWFNRGWRFVAGLFSERARFVADFCLAFERGEGGTVYTWWFQDDMDPTSNVEDLISELDEAVRRAPAPFGMDTGKFVVKVYGRHRDDESGVDPDASGRKLLQDENLDIDRYYDWNRGRAKDDLRELLHQVSPRPGAPLVRIGYFPHGGAAVALLKSGRWALK